MADIEIISPTLTGNWTFSSYAIVVTPATDYHIATKKYVDDNAGGAPEGTAVKSTGETGANLFLGEDGDGTCSWKTPAGGGDVTASVALTADTLIQGDGGAKGIKTSTATITDISNNTSSCAAVTTLSVNNAASCANIAVDVGLNTSSCAAIAVDVGLNTASCATIAALSASNEASCANIAVDVGLNTSSCAVVTALAVVNAASCANIAAESVENTSSCANIAADVGLNTTHRGDNTQAHTDYLLNNDSDTTSGIISAVGYVASATISGALIRNTADYETASGAYVANIVYFATGGNEPIVTDHTRGTILVEYTP